MTLDQLRIFLAVAHREHVTRAAEALNMTQSAVSAAIAALEARHGVVLFDRVGRGIALTAAGRSFVPHAQDVLQRATEAAGALTDLGSRIGGELRVAASQTVASYWLPPFLVRYRHLYPQVALEFRTGNTTSVATALLKGDADIGVVEGEVSERDLVVKPLARDMLMVLVGPAHPWADGRPLGADDLLDSQWVLREQGSGTLLAFEAKLRSDGVDPARLPVLMELPTNEACLAAVAGGKVATALSRRAAEPYLQQGMAAEAAFPLPGRNFSALWHRTRHQSRAAQAMLELMSEAPSG